MYRGDLETIAAKALAKEKERRYGSAAELAADLRRYLADEPITARPSSALYQPGKYARRNKAFMGAVAAVAVVLAGGIIASTLFALGEREARELADERLRETERQVDINQRVLEFLALHPGSRSEDIGAILGTDAASLRPVLHRLRDEGKVKVEGKARATRYTAKK